MQQLQAPITNEESKVRELLFTFDSRNPKDPEDKVNMIRVYSDNTYTADGRGKDVIKWKYEDGKIWWANQGNAWDEARSRPFIDGFIKGLLEYVIEESILKE
jgi:hypothetical protein